MGIYKPITNTEKDATHPEWCMGGNPAAIERQELQGQKELVAGSQLPIQTDDDRSILEKAGVVFGRPTEDDPLFCPATLPVGWHIRPTEHSMWSELVDGNGNVRATIFYKAAFYDRHAFLVIKPAPAGA